MENVLSAATLQLILILVQARSNLLTIKRLSTVASLWTRCDAPHNIGQRLGFSRAIFGIQPERGVPEMSSKLHINLCALSMFISFTHASAAIVIGAGNTAAAPGTAAQIPFIVQKAANDAGGFASATVNFSFNSAVLSAAPTFTASPMSPWPGIFILGCTFNMPGQASCGFATLPPFANPVVPMGSYIIGTLNLPLALAISFPQSINVVIEECTDQSGNVLPPGSCAAQNGVITFADPPPFMFSNGFE